MVFPSSKSPTNPSQRDLRIYHLCVVFLFKRSRGLDFAHGASRLSENGSLDSFSVLKAAASGGFSFLFLFSSPSPFLLSSPI